MHHDYGCETRAWFAERVFEIEQGEDLLWILQLESPKQLGSPPRTSRNPTHNGATPHLSNHSHFDIGHHRLHPLNVLFRFEILGDEVGMHMWELLVDGTALKVGERNGAMLT